VATVTAPVIDTFVPQMLNYESVGGVNFKKGCYPGQEVVARSQFRGTLKRRAFIVHADSEMAAGEEIFIANDDSQPVATVVQAAPAPQGGFDAIISGQLAAVEAGGLHLGRNTGPALHMLPLPYPLLDDV
jgi:folate-binding protein YgfZ